MSDAVDARRHALFARWGEINRHLTQLLRELPAIDAAGGVMVREFLDHNELGLAFEDVAFLIEDLRAVLTPGQQQRLERVRRLLETPIEG